MSFAVIIDASDVKTASGKLRLLGDLYLGDAVNTTAQRGFEESRRVILSGVNLTDEYVRERMGVEPANDLRNPTATIVAFRVGGRRPGLRGVNLRQYAAVVQQVPTNWSNSGVARNSGRQIFIPNEIAPNPRKPGGWLPFKARIGDPQQGIPVGRKSAGVSVEVTKGSRKTIDYAFMRRMANGQILVMAREKGDHKGKGKIHALSSLSVWQMFKSDRVMSQVIPFVTRELEREVAVVMDDKIQQVIG